MDGNDDENYEDESGPMSLTIVTREQNEQIMPENPN